jgi:serine/threonine protein kinase
MDCLNYLKELMWGAHMLHQKYNLLHRAIVPANLQIDQNNQLRLVNYCSCLPCYDGEGSPINYIKNDRKYESYHSGELDEMFEEGEFDLGEYAAPEVAKGQPYNYLVDFYAIGVIIKKLYEQSQVLEKVPVSQNNENLMMTMINKLTSADLEERAAIAEEIIENIERENLEGEQAVLAATTINLQEIKVGRPIELGEVKRFI